MKKKLLSCIAAVTAFACVLCACGGGEEEEQVTPDREAPAFSDAAATFTIDGKTTDNVTGIISDTLFGVFLEDINFAGYLLDDNLVFNGSFESFNGKMQGWQPTNTGASFSIASSGGVLANELYYKDAGQGSDANKGVNKNYANVNVTAANSGISNKGRTEMPMAVENGVQYLFSAFVKTAVSDATMKVTVKNNTTTYCEADIPLQTGGWVKYEQTLTASATASENIKMDITFNKTGAYSVDAVSLETQHSTGGIKQYVFDAIKDLGPKFVRFPGGCIIEGDAGVGGADCTRVYDWKNSVGAVQTGTAAGADDIPAFEYTLVKDGAAATTVTTYGEWATRRQNGDLWGYDMEYGIGFYEYFLLCENLGASAVPVVNCGLSDQGGANPGNPKGVELNGRHGNKVNDYIQDAIDLIEFAKGATTTKWGALREKLGHPDPFEMDYIGIGNEQFGTYYTQYYEKFLKSAAFQSALKDYNVKPIVGNSLFSSDCQKGTDNGGTARSAAKAAVNRGDIPDVKKVADYGVHDQHYYVNYSKLFELTGMYDGYARSDIEPNNYYEVFVGEYSANGGEGNPSGYPTIPNSLITAISEAAIMTNYEENGDIIKLAAYAPMFGVANTNRNPATGGDDISNQWDVDMMYFTNTQIVKSANYYIQQLFMQNQGKYRLPNSKLQYASGVDSTCTLISEGNAVAKTVNKLYTVASKAENGDLILKVVNASGENIKLNVEVKNAEAKGIAYYTEVSNAESDWKALNTLEEEKVTSKQEILGFSDGKLGQEIKAYSAVCFRLTVK